MNVALRCVISLVGLSTALTLPVRAAAPPVTAPPREGSAVNRPQASLAPVKASEAVSTHSPFGLGECGLCHERKDPKNPGPAIRPINSVCFYCHEDVQTVMTRSKFRHAPAERDCTICHNPHNSKAKKLLSSDYVADCNSCHPAIAKRMNAKVQHDVMKDGSACGNCHSPHASNVEKILLRLPFDQCVGCHSKDGMQDSNGKPMTNFKKWLAENPIQHAPVAQKDCSACHQPHGSDHTRLCLAEYPPEFYAPFEPANYALCFTCHDERMVTAAETRTETRFRDGSKNLHFAHVNRQDRGRICRACHEVHASKLPYLIRDSVPYGSMGWMLKVGFTKNPDGGTCDKTCHTARTYVNVTKKK